MPSAAAPVDAFDKGDFYRVNGQATPLWRWANAVSVRVTDADPAGLLAALTAADGPLNGFNVLRPLDEHTFMLTCPPSNGQSPSLALADGDARLGIVEATTGVGWTAPVFHNPESGGWLAATDEVVVALQPGVDGAAFFSGNREFAAWRHLDGTPDQFVATLASGSGAATLAASENSLVDNRVRWATPNFYQSFSHSFIPNDTNFGSQWHLRNTGQGGGTPNADVNAATAWDTLAGGSSAITIAIVDDGIELTHPDLAANIFKNAGEIAANGKDDDNNGWIDDVNGWDFTSPGSGGVVGDNDPGASTVNDAHGTATAGVAAAAGNNGKGVAGAAYNSKILPMRIFIGGSATTDSNIASAIYYAAGRTRNGLGQWSAANVTSNSWGGGSLTQPLIDSFTWASNTARGGKGVASFIATGNNGGAVSNPATLSATVPGVIAVGSSTNQDLWASYSNFGSQVDLLAPSDGGTLAITTTDRIGGNGYSGGDYTSSFGGTSSATPLAAGVGALALAQDPNLTASQLRGFLRNTTDLVGGVSYDAATGFNSFFGYGRVDAANAVSGAGKAEVQVIHNGSTNIADGSGIADFGTVTTGTSVTQTFRVRNQGTLDLSLSGLTLASGAFTLVTGFGSTTLKVGQSTTFTVKFAPAAAGLVNETLSFTNNDADEGAFDFTVRGTGRLPSISGTAFNDLDYDGVFDGGEPGLAGRSVFLDQNANGVADQKTFTNATSTAIPDNNATGVQSKVTVSGVGTVTGIKVTVNITHTYDGDLALSLIGPTGKSVPLSTNRGGSGNNFTATIFDDAASKAISAGSAPFTGSFRPESPLSAYSGLNADGSWSLKVVDSGQFDTGTINNWTLTLTEASVTTGGTGAYQFDTLGPATYNVRQVVPGGWVETAPAGGKYSVVLPFGGAVGGRDFGTALTPTAPTVTVDQAASQPDPTNSNVNFTVVFSSPVSDFTDGDVTIGGTALPTTAKVTGSGTTYNVEVSGMSLTGTVTASVAAGVANGAGGANLASTSTDNVVLYDATAPTIASDQFDPVTTGGGTTYLFTVTFSDDTAISVASLGDGDVRITGPGGYDVLAKFLSVDVNLDGTPRTANYTITPPGGSWDNADNGTYDAAIEASQITDTAGNSMSPGLFDSFSVNIPGGKAPTVTAVAVNDGSAGRSRVTSMKITFSDVVTLPAVPADAFQLSRTGPGSPTGNVALTVDTSGSTATETVAVLTFSGSLTEGTSIIDGDYTLTVLSSQVSLSGVALDGDNNGSAGGDYTTNVHRLFGDSDGDRDVDVQDYGAFRGSFGTAAFAFDIDGDGDVDAGDYGAFRGRFGTALP